MLAPLFGVKNPAEDYSCGINLLAADAPRRNYAVIANWSQIFFAGEKYKSLIPQNAHDFALQTITDANDRPVEEVSVFYREYGKELVKLQKDLTRFTAAD